MTTPIDEYLESRPKTAAHPFGPAVYGMGDKVPPMPNVRTFGAEVGRELSSGAAKAIGAGAVGLGAATLGVAGMKLYRAVTKAHDFRQMMEASPDLAELQEKNPTLFNTHYNSLRSLAPGYAQDPVIAGSLMRQMSMSPETAGSVLMSALESRAKTGPGLNAGLGDNKLSLRF
jgi:hypothetical protein